MPEPVQLSFFESPPHRRIVNTATIRQLSPFRYPGGKTWLVPRLKQWLVHRPCSVFVEPFVGGGILSLTVAAEKLAPKVIMVEKDEQVSAVWKTVLNQKDAQWLANRIVNFELTPDSLQTELNQPVHSYQEQAFQTILKNRTFHGGILARGSAPLKQGENGKGIQSRWYPETLKKRILFIATLRDQITFFEGDGLEIIKEYIDLTEVNFFIDPPYTMAGKKAGRRLYTHSELDHKALFHQMSCARGDFLMTYDDVPEVHQLADQQQFQVKAVAMKNTHHAEMSELLIGRDLAWLDHSI